MLIVHTFQLKALAVDPNIVTSLELHELMSRLDLSKDESESRRPSYDELYPDGWAWDKQAELRHREAVHKIVHWPANDKHVVQY